jgi:hypothetical protein
MSDLLTVLDTHYAHIFISTTNLQLPQVDGAFLETGDL